MGMNQTEELLYWQEQEQLRRREILAYSVTVDNLRQELREAKENEQT